MTKLHILLLSAKAFLKKETYLMKKFSIAIFAFILMFICACGNLSEKIADISKDGDIDLMSFYNLESEKYEFSSMVNFSPEEINTYYDGFNNIEFEKSLIYTSKTSENTAEVALLKIKEAADLEKVVSIIYERKGSIEATWQNNKNNCDITTNDNYILFIVDQNAVGVANDFDKLFK